MAVLDILSLPLIDSDLRVDDVSTGLGRIWALVLESILYEAQAVSVDWGRDRHEDSVLVLFIGWEDKQTRDKFHRNGLGITALTNYLSRTMDIRYVLDVPSEDIAALENSIVSISIEQESNVDTGSARLIKGKVHRLELCADSHGINDVYEPDVKIASRSRDSLEDGTEANKLIHVVVLARAAVNHPPQTPHTPCRLTKLSQVFTRDRIPYGQPLDSNKDEKIEIEGPQLCWRSPEQTCLVQDLCFSNRSAAPPPTQRFSHLYGVKPANEHLEVERMTFEVASDSTDNEESEPAQAMRAYRRLLLSAKHCTRSWVITDHHAAPAAHCVDIVSAWSSQRDADEFHASTDARAARDRLARHLSGFQPPLRSAAAVPFRPRRDEGFVEIVDFSVRSAATAVERRAVEYYVWALNELMTNNSSLGEPSVVYPAHEGWVEDEAEDEAEEGEVGEARMQTPLDTTAETPSLQQQQQQQRHHHQQSQPSDSTRNTYRVVFYWDGAREAAQWIKEFVEAPYALTGCRAHRAALASDSVHAKQVHFKRDSLADLREVGEEEEEEEDLGF